MLCGDKLIVVARKMVFVIWNDLKWLDITFKFQLYWNILSIGLMPGNHAVWSHFLDKLLDLIVQQKRLILSDREFLPSLMTSLLSSSCHSLLVPNDVEQRYSFITVLIIILFI